MYKMFNEIAETAIEHEGTVFGGYVRDLIRHDKAAKMFYESLNKKEDYDDPVVSPETRDRLLVPRDIDVHFTSFKPYREFRHALRTKYFHSHVIQIENVYTTVSSVNHIKMRVTPDLQIGRIIKSLPGIKSGTAHEVIFPELIKCLKNMSTSTDYVDVDILISPNLNPPFSNLDFECNGLVMNTHGISLCEELKRNLKPIGIHRMRESVIKNIEDKKAVLVNLKAARWDKMCDKNWDIVGGNIEKINKEGEVCALCLDDISIYGLYKFRCCNASYHCHCLTKIISVGQTAVADTNKCTHCRQSIYLTPEEVKVFGEITPQ